MSEQKVATEVAVAEFKRFLDSMDIEHKASSMDEEEKVDFESIKRKIVGAIEDGRLVIDDRGQPVFTTSSGESLTFSEPTGAALLAMDQKKKGYDMHKLFAFMANVTGTNAAKFSGMQNRDLKICIAVATSFLS